MPRPVAPSPDPLVTWLSLSWTRPERSYNPDLQRFFSGLLGYPLDRVITEDRGPVGFPDLKLQTQENHTWVIGDLKPDDAHVTSLSRRDALWEDKRKYVSGLTRYAVFATAHYLWVLQADGHAIDGLEEPIDLRTVTLDELRGLLLFLRYDTASHPFLWKELISGKLPYSYLNLQEPDAVRQLRQDLKLTFAELTEVALTIVGQLKEDYQKYLDVRQAIQQNLGGESQQRALNKLERDSRMPRRMFEESIPQFQDQYGREVGEGQAMETKIREAFVADSVAALIARVLFLRLLEDLNLIPKRRITNGGPARWADFVEHLTGSASALVRVASEDLSHIYKENFDEGTFDWIQHVGGSIDEPLQRLILRLNAYDFSGLSEELLGDIYQQFLPPSKRKQLGEFYTPPSIVDWLLDASVMQGDEGDILDPSSGSGSFLVRCLHQLLQEAQARGFDPLTVRVELQQRLWGFDLNPFASFISRFQLMWGLLRYHASGSPPTIHVYNLNSLLKDNDIAQIIGKDHLAPGSLERDTKKWQYIIGNPPYIRAERVKYGPEMQQIWNQIWGQNSDTGLVFLYRSLKEWLENGGTLAMVVSHGYASSEAAAKVWKMLQPGGIATLKKLGWLEFVTDTKNRQASFWDAARIPMMLVIERRPATEQDQIEVHVPQNWPETQPPQLVKYEDYFDRRVNPLLTVDVTGRAQGEHLLPLLQQDDVDLLRRLQPDALPNVGNSPFMELRNTVAERRIQGKSYWWGFGIQRGGVDLQQERSDGDVVQVVAGRSLSVAYPGDVAGWLDLSLVQKKSLWREEEKRPLQYLAVVKIARAPTAALVTCEQDFVASLDSTVVALPRVGGPAPAAIIAYLNSGLARFYWALKLRSGVLMGYYSQIYPRNLEVLPWPKLLPADLEHQMVTAYQDLEALSVRAKDAPGAWLTDELDRQLSQAQLLLSQRSLGLSFSVWEAPLPSTLEIEGTRIFSGQTASLELSDETLARFVYTLLTLPNGTDAEEKAIERVLIQRLLVPAAYAQVLTEYEARVASFATVQQEFMSALTALDETVFQVFGLTDVEKAYVQHRLATHPLNRLTPRYPWNAVSIKPLLSYTSDRWRS